MILVVVIVSFIIYSAPVDPARMTFGERLDLESVELKRQQLGLDKGLMTQVSLYLKDLSPMLICGGSAWSDQYKGWSIPVGGGYIVGFKLPYLRESYQTGRKVSEIIMNAFPNTLILASLAIFLALILGSAGGLVAAVVKDSFWDRLIIFMSTLGYSVPSYVTAILLAVIFGYFLRDVSGLNIQGSLFELDDFGDRRLKLSNLVLPAIALGVRPVSIIAQLMRSAAIQVLSEKYVMVARAKGLQRFRLIKQHVMKNAFNPVVTALTGWFASLLAGAFFVEYIFSFKGLGFVTVNALLNYDIPVVLGALLFTSSLFILINILVDLIYKFLDPRITI